MQIATDELFEAVVIGAGPAGLSAGLNLARARRKTLLIDSNRPRHCATMMSHGFISRDGTAPNELRKVGRDDVLRYPEAKISFGLVRGVKSDPYGFRIIAKGVQGHPDLSVLAKTVLLSSGLAEVLPSIPSIRNFYGMQLFSCIECDGYDLQNRALALIGETDDLAERALLLSQWSDEITVFTNAKAVLSESERNQLAGLGISVNDREIADFEGQRTTLTGVRLVDGSFVPVTGGFIRPVYETRLDYLTGLSPASDAAGFLEVDAFGRTSIKGIYAAGDIVAPGPQQLIVAAGAGAKAAAAINRDLIGF